MKIVYTSRESTIKDTESGSGSRYKISKYRGMLDEYDESIFSFRRVVMWASKVFSSWKLRYLHE